MKGISERTGYCFVMAHILFTEMTAVLRKRFGIIQFKPYKSGCYNVKWTILEMQGEQMNQN